MAYDGKYLARARAELENIRARNLDEQQQRQRKLYRRIPRIEEIDAAMRAQMAELVRLTVSHRSDLAARIDELKESNLAMQREKAELLKRESYPENYLDAIYSCPKCRDSGVYMGGVCTCLERLYNAELTKDLGSLMRRGDECFEHFDLSLYPADFDAALGHSPRDVMKTVFSACKLFAENFSDSSPSLLLQGGTGLGKTYLSACIARVVSRKGFSVCYDSASAALEYFERAKFSRDTDEGETAAARVRRMQDCDLMILDDLGTEMLTPMSQSALYTLINTRLINGRKTIISTNLTDAELAKKYTPQIASRIVGEFHHLPFCGRDIRLLNK